MDAGQAAPDMREFFDGIKTIAVVGYSDKPERAGHFVPKYLRQHGYNIIAINPKLGPTADGLPNYASLASLPSDTAVDVIDVFRAPEHVPALAREAAAMQPRPRYFVMQPGAESEEAALIAQAAGIIPLELCLMAELRALGG